MKNCRVNRVNKKNCRSEKSQGNRGHRKVKCEISQALVMINLYVKFNVHSSYVKQVIVLKSGGQTDGRTDAPGDDNRHPPPKKQNDVHQTMGQTMNNNRQK